MTLTRAVRNRRTRLAAALAAASAAVGLLSLAAQAASANPGAGTTATETGVKPAARHGRDRRSCRPTPDIAGCDRNARLGGLRLRQLTSVHPFSPALPDGEHSPCSRKSIMSDHGALKNPMP